MSFEEPETGKEKLMNKLMRDPLVPLGSLATCGALVYATYYMRKGRRDQFQSALRWRVALQGITVVAAAASIFLYRPTKRTDEGVPLHWNHEANERKIAMSHEEWRKRFLAAHSHRAAEDAAVRRMIEEEIAARDAREAAENAKRAPAPAASPEPEPEQTVPLATRIGQDKRKFTFTR